MTERRSLLLLDEEEASCQQLLTLLGRFRDRCDIEVFHEGMAAQRVIESRAPNLLLMDPRLPDVNGLDLIQIILEEFPGTDVVVLLPTGMENVGQKALAAGAVGLLTKPYQASQVEEVVSRCLGIQVGLHGDLEGISLSDLVQLIHSKKWDRTVTVTSGDGKVGRIYFLRGEIRHAETDVLLGVDGFNQMLDWPQGRFEIRTGCATSTRTVEIPTMQLLLDGLRQSDEGSKSAPAGVTGSDDEIGALFDSMVIQDSLEEDAPPHLDTDMDLEPPSAQAHKKPAAKRPAPAKKESTPTAAERMDRSLERLRSRWNLASSCAVVNGQGFVVAGKIEGVIADGFWSQLFGATAAFFDDTKGVHRRGQFREAVLRGNEGCLVVLTVPGTSCFLVATTRADARLGLVLSGLESSLEELGTTLQELVK